MRNAFLVIVLLVSLGALFFLLLAPPRVISLFGNVLGVATDTISGAVPPLTITSGSTTSSVVSTTIARGVTDIEYQKSLPNPPAIVKGIYATGWSAGSVNKMKYLTGLIDRTELNAIVIDIK